MVTVFLNLTEFQVESITLCLVHSYLVKKTPVSSNNKTDCHNITEILLKVVLKIITLTPSSVEFLIVLAYWNISPQVDKSLHSDTLS
jgi:hypothetical protein